MANIFFKVHPTFARRLRNVIWFRLGQFICAAWICGLAVICFSEETCDKYHQTDIVMVEL